MIKVHHLKESRSTRILWLLEELGVPYQREDYERDPATRLAPLSLRAVHPLGKSPIVEDDGLVLIESAAIMDYLLDKYGEGKLRPTKGSANYYSYQQWMHFAEGSAMLPVLLKLFLGHVENQSAPVFAYARKEAELDFTYIDKTLQNAQWIVGDTFSAADIMVATVLLFAQKQDMIGKFANIHAYLQEVTGRAAFQKVMAFG